MRKLTVFASLLFIVGLAMPAAFAMSSTLVSVGGDTSSGTDAVTGFNDGATYFVTDWGTPLDCHASEGTGTVERGAPAVQGSVIGEVTDLEFGNCAMSGWGYPFELSSNPAPWPVIATETPANAGDPVSVEIRNVSMYMHSTGSPPWPCELDLVSDAITGTYYPGVTANGNDGRIETSTSGFPWAITAYDGTGMKTVNPPNVGTCGGRIYTDDAANMFGNFEMNVDPSSPGMNPVSHE